MDEQLLQMIANCRECLDRLAHKVEHRRVPSLEAARMAAGLGQIQL
jgi:hypothetical protein